MDSHPLLFTLFLFSCISLGIVTAMACREAFLRPFKTIERVEDFLVQSIGRKPNANVDEDALWQRMLLFSAMEGLLAASVFLHMVYGKGIVAFGYESVTLGYFVFWMALVLRDRSLPTDSE